MNRKSCTLFHALSKKEMSRDQEELYDLSLRIEIMNANEKLK